MAIGIYGHDSFTGSTNSTAVDVLDARMSNSLEFDIYNDGTDDWIEVSGYNEIHQKLVVKQSTS